MFFLILNYLFKIRKQTLTIMFPESVSSASITQTIVAFRQYGSYHPILWTLYDEKLSTVLSSLINSVEKFMIYISNKRIDGAADNKSMPTLKLAEFPLFETLTSDDCQENRAQIIIPEGTHNIVMIDLHKQRVIIYNRKIDPAFMFYSCDIQHVKSSLEYQFAKKGPNWEPSTYITMRTVGFTDEATFDMAVNNLMTNPDIDVLKHTEKLLIFSLGYHITSIYYSRPSDNMYFDFVFHASAYDSKNDNQEGCQGRFIYKSIPNMFKKINME